MSEPRFIVIGVSDSRSQQLPAAALEAVARGRVFSGGRRHRELVGHLLPGGHEWIDVTVPLQDVFSRYRGLDEVVVFASGDPLFFGYAATLRREFPAADIRVIPAFSSLQMLAHRMCLPYQEMVNVSLTGRPLSGLDPALIEGRGLIGVLTDRRHTPSVVARLMLDYGYDNYDMTVGENLGNEETERVRTLTLAEVAGMEFDLPNCLILRRQRIRPRPLGIPEGEFDHLNGRAKMITKMPARLLSLSMLGLGERTSLWDVGFCTGSVSIEARLQYPSLTITSFEKRPEGKALMEANSRRFGALSLTPVIGDFFDLDLGAYPRPDAVFIGGHGGRLAEMMERICRVLLPGGVVVFNSVSPESCEAFRAAASACGLAVTASTRLVIDDNNPLTIMQAQ